MYRLYFVAILLFFSSVAFGQKSAKEIGLTSLTPELIESQLSFLASDWTEGREIGTKGSYLASDYIKSIFQYNGLKPIGDAKTFRPNRYERLQKADRKRQFTYFQPFQIVELNATDKHQLKLKSNNGVTTQYGFKTDFFIGIQSESIQFSGSVVFVGYGEKQEDYEGVDGKLVLCVAGSEKKPENRRLMRQKMSWAKKSGAVAMFYFDPKQRDISNWVENVPFRYNSVTYEGDVRPESYYDKRMILPGEERKRIAVVKISNRLMRDLLKFSSIDLGKNDTWKKSVLPNSKVQLSLKATPKLLQARNVLGMIEGENRDEIVVVGAHYDHLGMHNGRIWNGADDNASGVVAVMSIARAFKASGVKPKRTIVFACWDGEERGLLGSKYFASTIDSPSKYVAYLNFDMIGRDSNPEKSKKEVIFYYTKAYNELEKMDKRNVKKYSLNLETRYRPWENPVGGSDNGPFAELKIPIFWYFSGMHPDYHKATDHTSLINYNKMLEIIKVSYLNVWELANKTERLSKKQTTN